MACSVQVWTSLVDLAMDGKSRSIDGRLSTTWLNFALLTDKDKVRNLDLGEVSAEGVDPEVLCVEVSRFPWLAPMGFLTRVERVTERNVPSNTLIEALTGKDPERGC